MKLFNYQSLTAKKRKESFSQMNLDKSREHTVNFLEPLHFVPWNRDQLYSYIPWDRFQNDRFLGFMNTYETLSMKRALSYLILTQTHSSVVQWIVFMAMSSAGCVCEAIALIRWPSLRFCEDSESVRLKQNLHLLQNFICPYDTLNIFLQPG